MGHINRVHASHSLRVLQQGQRGSLTVKHVNNLARTNAQNAGATKSPRAHNSAFWRHWRRTTGIEYPYDATPGVHPEHWSVGEVKVAATAQYVNNPEGHLLGFVG
jgi:hypothetical protein